MAVNSDRAVGLSCLGRKLGIRDESALEELGDIIERVGWNLISDNPRDVTVDKFRREYDAMMEAAKEIGARSMPCTISGLNSAIIVRYLEELGRTYKVVGTGASGGDTVSSEPRGGHPFKKDSGFRHPYRREKV